MDFDNIKMMGILNVTPDSFSDGSLYLKHNVAINHAKKMVEEGADIIDIGGESTFGKESLISPKEEIKRIGYVLKEISNDVFISVDTYKAEVARFALENGAKMINDVTALRGDARLIDVLVEFKPYVCLMYSSYNHPFAGRDEVEFDDVILTIKKFLQQKIESLVVKGFPKDKIIVDPGLGFFLSKNASVSWEVLNRLGELKSLGYPILVGTSMKSYLGGKLQDRLPKSLEAAKLAINNGASIVRVHHVKEHVDLLNG